jgi:hypothetical protein
MSEAFVRSIHFASRSTMFSGRSTMVPFSAIGTPTSVEQAAENGEAVAVAVAGCPEFGSCVFRLRLAEGDVVMTSLAGRSGPVPGRCIRFRKPQQADALPDVAVHADTITRRFNRPVDLAGHGAGPAW